MAPGRREDRAATGDALGEPDFLTDAVNDYLADRPDGVITGIFPVRRRPAAGEAAQTRRDAAADERRPVRGPGRFGPWRGEGSSTGANAEPPIEVPDLSSPDAERSAEAQRRANLVQLRLNQQRRRSRRDQDGDEDSQSSAKKPRRE